MCLVLGIHWASWLCRFAVFIKFGKILSHYFFKSLCCLPMPLHGLSLWTLTHIRLLEIVPQLLMLSTIFQSFFSSVCFILRFYCYIFSFTSLFPVISNLSLIHSVYFLPQTLRFSFLEGQFGRYWVYIHRHCCSIYFVQFLVVLGSRVNLLCFSIFKVASPWEIWSQSLSSSAFDRAVTGDQ